MGQRRRVLGIVAIGGLALLVVACEGKDPAPATLTSSAPTATGTKTFFESLTPTPVPPPLFNGQPAREMRVVDPIPFPANTAVYTTEHPVHHGGAAVFYFKRYYRLGDGPLQVDILLDGKPGQSVDPKFEELVVGPAGRAMFVVQCVPVGPCSFLGDRPGATFILHRSLDGGVTWHEVGRGETALSIRAVHGDEAIVVRGANRISVSLPSGRAVALPADVVSYRTAFDYSGQPAWPHERLPLLVGLDGPLLAVDLPVGASIDEGLAGDRVVITFRTPHTGTYVAAVAATGQVGDVVRAPTARPAALAPDGRVLLTMHTPRPSAGCAPGRHDNISLGLLDLKTGDFAPFKELLGEPCTTGPHFTAHYAAFGPIARVNTPGDCLQVRASPSREGAVVSCAAHGVLLTPTGRVFEAEGASWAAVLTPAGLAGWVSAQFLER